MTIEFIRTLRQGSSGDDEDGSWSHVRLCRRDDGQHFFVAERTSWSPDHDDWDVTIYPCDSKGEILSPRHPVSSMGGGSDSGSDERITAAVAGITAQQIADAITKARDPR